MEECVLVRAGCGLSSACLVLVELRIPCMSSSSISSLIDSCVASRFPNGRQCLLVREWALSDSSVLL